MTGGAVRGLGQAAQRGDDHGAGVDTPGRGHPAVHQHHALPGHRKAPVGVVDDPAPVLIPEDRVVERGQEPHRRWRVGVGAWRAGEVQQLAAAFIAEADQFLAYRGHRGRESGQAAPGAQIG
ncbi:hypothetical protein GCM10009680_36600 [Streptomyces yatensis]|uniref:Uncharacterized protein n=1 Tax=Streptomyces yatensis TaxID=155177 RepID=A0ABP4TWG4_9ACTN